MEGVLAIILIFGGGAAAILAYSPVGKALSDRIRGGVPHGGPDPEVLNELKRCGRT
jgi:H+/gluconate symporter-like permease